MAAEQFTNARVHREVTDALPTRVYFLQPGS